MEITTANTMEVTTAKAVVRLTIELPVKHAAELGGLLCHLDWEDFPWAESIYDALLAADIRGEAVFTDSEYGPDIFLARKQG